MESGHVRQRSLDRSSSLSTVYSGYTPSSPPRSGGGSYNPAPLPPQYDAPPREASFGPNRSHGSRDEGGPRHDPYGYPERPHRLQRDPPRRQAASSIDRVDPRTAEEKPSRTLFVRNIDNNNRRDQVREFFAQYGELRTFFDLIQTRGICFVTFYDLRAAEWVKSECHAMEYPRPGDRKLDVHYSLPKDQDTSKRCDREQNQGTLFILLKQAPNDLSDDDFREAAARFGEIKSLRRYRDTKNARFLEFFDSRACVAAHDALLNQPWYGSNGTTGTWDVKFAWDAHSLQGKKGEAGPGGEGADGRNRGAPGRLPASGANAWSPGPEQGNAGQPAQGSDSGWGSRSSSQNYGRSDSGYARRDSHGSYPPNGSSRSPPDRRRIARPGPYGSNPYAAFPPGQTVVAAPSADPRSAAAAGGAGGDDRLEQAQKVQQLLASLSAGGGAASTAAASTAAAAPRPPPWEEKSAPPPAAAPTGLPSNLAGLLAKAGAGVGAASAPAKDPPPAPATTGQKSANEAQDSIQKMLAMLGQGGAK